MKYQTSVKIYSFRYGDKVPRTIYGRIFSVLWILTGVCLIAIFTAAVTSAITVSSVDSDCKSTQGKHVSDLSGFSRFHPSINRSQGRSQGGSWGACDPPFCKQTTYNIQVTIWWEPSVWLSVTPLWKILATPMDRSKTQDNFCLSCFSPRPNNRSTKIVR